MRTDQKDRPGPSRPEKGFRESLPNVRQAPVIPLAVLAADLHLCHTPPIARSCEKDWYKVQRRYIRQLFCIGEYKRVYPPCVILAGDIFDRWNPPPELVNMLLGNIPTGRQVYGVPGQHDLPNHRYQDLRKTAYWTLVQARKLQNLPPRTEALVEGVVPLMLYGFPWGYPVTRLKRPHDLAIHVAVVHSYIWKEGKSYSDYKYANNEHHYKKYDLRGYDVAIFGDNHIPFGVKTDSGCHVFNAGSFMRRHSDEKNHRPSVGVLYSNGHIKRTYLDVSKDTFIEDTTVKEIEGIDFNPFVRKLLSLAKDRGIDVADMVRRLAGRTDLMEGAGECLLSVLEEALNR